MTEIDACENCGTPLQGGFCSRCGQSGKDYDVPIGEFARDFASEALGLDSRLRLTLMPLFFKPGAVPRDYVAGHRARFVPPVRLYVFASFAMFLLWSMSGGLNVGNVTMSDNADVAADSSDVSAVEDSVTVRVSEAPEPDTASSDSIGVGSESGERTLGQRLGDRLNEGLRVAAEDAESFSSDFLNRLAQAMFILLPAFAFLLKIAYRERLYIQHLVFSVYYHSLAFLVMAFVSVPGAVGFPVVSDWLALLVLLLPIYLLLAMRRFYGQSWIRTFVKFAFVTVAYWAVSLVMFFALLLVALINV